MKLLRRIFPHPQLTALLVLVWCLLGNSFSINTLAFGLLLGIVIPSATASYWPDRPTLRNFPKVAEYILLVLYDICVANFVVAWLVLFRRNDSLQPNWVEIPLELKSPEAITVLAGTITMTPGTLSADLSSSGHVLLVHCINAPDPGAVRDDIKQRYEGRLKEIFE